MDRFNMTLEPKLVEALYGARDDIDEDEVDLEELEEIQIRKQRILRAISLLPDRERDMLKLRYQDNLSLSAIARIFGVTQAAIGYRLRRVIERIKFLIDIMELGHDIIWDWMDQNFAERVVLIVREIVETTNQSEVARRCNHSIYYVRRVWLEMISLLSYILYRKWVIEKVTKKDGKLFRLYEEVEVDLKILTRLEKNLMLKNVEDVIMTEDEDDQVKKLLKILTEVRNNFHICMEKLHKWRACDKRI